jgi:hypothetical protein
VKCKGVFIGLESNGRLNQGHTSAYYSPTVQRLLRTSRYYLVVNPKSSIRLVFFSVCPLYYSQSTAYYLSTYVRWSPVYVYTKDEHTSGVSAYVYYYKQEHTFANPSVRPIQKYNFSKCLYG